MADKAITKTAGGGLAAPTKLRAMLRAEETVSKFAEFMTRESALAFISSVLVEVANREDLQKCDPVSIMTAAMKAATLKLSVDSSLGLAYLVPFGRTCTLIVGYRGIMQLALRTGWYRTINPFTIYEGMTVEEDPLTGRLTIKGHRQPGGAVLGYGVYFQSKEGYECSRYWTAGEILDHAKKYSKTFGKHGSPWTDPVEVQKMMKKTVIRNVLTKEGMLSPFDRAALETIDESTEEDGGGFTVDGSYTEDPGEAEPRDPDAIVDELFGGPFDGVSTDSLRRDKKDLQTRDGERGLSSEEIERLGAIEAELKKRDR